MVKEYGSYSCNKSSSDPLYCMDHRVLVNMLVHLHISVILPLLTVTKLVGGFTVYCLKVNVLRENF